MGSWFLRVILSAVVTYGVALAILIAAEAFFSFDVQAVANSLLEGMPWIVGAPKAFLDWLVDNPYWSIALALAPLALAFANSALIRALARFVAPEKPSFLDWLEADRDDSPWSTKPKLAGRDEELKRLEQFADNDERVLWYAVTGPPGVGKTRVAIEWLRRMKARGWQVGVLRASQRPDASWRAARDLAVVIDEAGRRPSGWADLDALLNVTGAKVRVLLVDTHGLKLPTAEQELRTLQACWYDPDLVDARRRTGFGGLVQARLQDRRRRSSEVETGTVLGEQLGVHNVEDFAAILADKLGEPLDPVRVREIHARSGGRVRFGLAMVDGSYAEFIEKEAAKWMDRAEREFGSDRTLGRRLLMTSALVNQLPIAHFDGAKNLALSSVSKLFQVDEKELKSSQQVPRIEPEEVSAAVALKVIEDIPRSEQLPALERIMNCAPESATAFGISVGNMLPFLSAKDNAEALDELIGLGSALRVFEHALVELNRAAGAPAPDATGGPLTPREEALLACVYSALKRGVLPRSMLAKMASRVVELAPHGVDTMPPKVRHAVLVGGLRDAARVAQMEEELDMLANSDVWAEHPVATASVLLVLLESAEWDENDKVREFMLEGVSVDEALQGLPTDSAIRPSLKAFKLMEEAFRRNVSAEEARSEEPMLAQLLRSRDPIEVAFSGWAVVWLTRTFALDEPIVQLGDEVADALCGTLVGDVASSTWRRAAAALARNVREFEDVVYQWAVHTDTNPGGWVNAPFSFVGEKIDPIRRDAALAVAGKKLNSPDEALSTRARAAILLAAFGRRDPAILSVLEALMFPDPSLPTASTNLRALRDMALIYSVGAFGSMSAEVLERIVTKGDMEVRGRAFIALASVGELKRLAEFDFGEWGEDGELYASTIQKVMNA